ncbi:hypothetical protein BN2476_1230046 [Paraburkholderia piptadeniae]|uniref:Acyltransferase 3 domain-containing protein n=1 Tax=Paraburkholderia piptadeniae TaxID=1701573 RepID=A0A1N7SX77_9BURK|nr:hypothetical protein [Paraburkholderia piptadeniae]SIT51514.1 hypothetical protein BN2476_1230046 [Paraburkholderia piptadeniae]
MLLCHYTEFGLIEVPAGFLNFVDGGRSAVSLFFVLSGFILTYTYRDTVSRGHAKAFYQARFARICPVLMLDLAQVRDKAPAKHKRHADHQDLRGECGGGLYGGQH